MIQEDIHSLGWTAQGWKRGEPEASGSTLILIALDHCRDTTVDPRWMAWGNNRGSAWDLRQKA